MSKLGFKSSFNRTTLAVGLFVALAAPGDAATYSVNQLADRVLSGDGCSLREAVSLHNANSATVSNDCGSGDTASDNIEFSATLNGGVVALNSRLGEIVLKAPALTIQTAKANTRVTLDGGNAMSVLVLHATTPPVLTLRRLTIQRGAGGRSPGSNTTEGGGIRSDVVLNAGAVPTTLTIEDVWFLSNAALRKPTDQGSSLGGALSSYGTLTLRRTKFVDSSAEIAAVFHAGHARIEDCEFTHNTGTRFASALSLWGDGIQTKQWVVERTLFSNNLGQAAAWLDDGGSAVVSNTSFLSNSSTNGEALFSSSPLWVSNSTFYDSRATVGGGGVLSTDAAQISVTSSLFAYNQVADLHQYSPSTSTVAFLASFNQFDSPAVDLPTNVLCGASTAGGLNLCSIADAGVLPVGFNGGPTLTLALAAWSPARDAGVNPRNLPTDQRGSGFPRTVGGVTDIGAYEFP